MTNNRNDSLVRLTMECILAKKDIPQIFPVRCLNESHTKKYNTHQKIIGLIKKHCTFRINNTVDPAHTQSSFL